MSGEIKNRRSEILRHAHQLLHERGFNAFSHRDLAKLVGVKSSSIHYYFPTKQDVGLALIIEYREELADFFSTLETLPVLERLQQFCELFVTSVQTGGWCLAGMLASDFDSLEAPLRGELQNFFDLAENWLAEQTLLLYPGLDREEALQRGKCGIAMLEGASLLARAQEDLRFLQKVAQTLPLLLSIKQA